MSTVTVTSAAELQSALSAAQAGDTISLAAGNYGDVAIYGKNFASDVTITSQTAGAAVFHSLKLDNSSHIDLDGVTVNYTATAATTTYTSAVEFNASSYITLTHSTITGGNAITGAAQSATGTDDTGNVLGLATGRGITVGVSNHVTINDVDVAHVYKGIVIATSDYVTVSNSEVHDTRTTPIVAGGGNHITIDSNHLYDVNPWRFGPTGDHADYLAMWTNAGQASASTDIKVTNNLMEQGAGQPVLGMWLQGGSVGYTNVQISGNTIMGGNFQGIVIWDVTGGTIDHNVLLQTSGMNNEDAPSILLTDGAEQISVHDNFTSAVNDKSGSTGALANTFADNHIVQMWNSSGAGYYTSKLISLIEQAGSYSSLYSFASANLPGLGGSPVAGETITGGLGADLLTSTNVAGGSRIWGGGGSDTLYGGSIGGTLRGEDGNDVIYAQHGFNDVNGNAGADTIFGGDGNDWLVGGRDNDEIHGGSGAQILYGNLGDDILIGGSGSEIIRGGQGADVMTGGAGNDWMSGDLGNDTITGGAGADTFHTFAGAGLDRITDFNSAQGDRVMIDAGTSYTLRFDGANMIVDMGGSDQLVLVGVTPSTIGTWLTT
jgi:Ca2+-binding RTX toxin-like protein